MPIEVTLAKLSPTMESGQIVRWAVKVGDKVKEGDLLAEVQTDKAVMNMEAFDDGVVAFIDVKEGEDIALGQRVLVLAQKGEDPTQVGAQSAKGSTKPVASSNGQTAPAEVAPVATVAASTASSAAAVSGGRVKSSPLARKVASAAGVDVAQVSGTGPNGRVIRADVDAFVQSKGSASTAASATGSKAPLVPGETKRIPHTPMRKTIAKRMLESKAVSPEIHVTVDIRLDKLMEIREALNTQLAPEKIKLSVGDFITKAVALALRKHPGLNASWEPDALVIHPHVNVGIAVAMEGGLMVPVIQNTDLMGLREIRQATEAVASAVRSGTLKPSQMMGGTFTISNLGMYGVKQFDAIINQPEVAILAVGAGEKRPVVENDQLAVGTVMCATLTADHRAVDGALAADFMRTLRRYLEEPASMLL